MFERYLENARRAIFFARYEANAFGSEYIDTHHLLLGALRADPEVARRLFKNEEAIAQLRRGLETRFPPEKDTPVSVDLPLSHESKRVLAYAAEEAERLKHKHIGIQHLLLGMLREDRCAAADALRQSGLNLEAPRDEAAHSPEQDPVFTRRDLHRIVEELPKTHVHWAGRVLEGLLIEAEHGVHDSSSHLSTGSSYAGPHWHRITEKVRRALFFARYEASQAGSPTIEPEHLLLGLLREDWTIASRFLKSQEAVQQLREEVARIQPPRQSLSSSLDLPLSEASLRAISSSAEEASRLGHKHIGTEHLFLGLLSDEKSFAAEILNRHGVTLASARAELGGQGQQ